MCPTRSMEMASGRGNLHQVRSTRRLAGRSAAPTIGGVVEMDCDGPASLVWKSNQTAAIDAHQEHQVRKADVHAPSWGRVRFQVPRGGGGDTGGLQVARSSSTAKMLPVEF
ncbi:unnamed protein product [Cutaneotrichosporon oleaginosum]